MLESLKTILAGPDALRLLFVGVIFVPVTIAMLMSAWFMINALAHGIASEFEIHPRCGELFNPFRFFIDRNYTEKGLRLKSKAIREFKRAILSLCTTFLLVGGAFIIVRYALKTTAH